MSQANQHHRHAHNVHRHGLQAYANFSAGRGVVTATKIQETLQTALALHQAGRLLEAEALYQNILKISPRHSDALHLLGMVAHHNGNNEYAINLITSAIKTAPTFPPFYNNLGIVFKAQGKLKDAIANFRKALELNPIFHEAHNNLGDTLKEQGDIKEAIASLQHAILLKPDFVEAHNNLGIALEAKGDLAEATASFYRAITLKPDYAEAHSNLGLLLKEQGNTEGAIISLHRAISLKPNLAGALVGLGKICQDHGQFDAAKAYFEQVLAIEPDHPFAFSAQPSLRKMNSSDRPWADKAQRLLMKGLKPSEEITLCFALGKYNDDIGQYETAFSYYSRANKLKQRLTGQFDREDCRQFIDQIIAAFTPEMVGQHPVFHTSDRPVFIIGMPRSGTSLVEQILASHPHVFGAGELDFWSSQARKLVTKTPSSLNDSALLQNLANQYEAELQRHSASAIHVIDKMPGNFVYLGLIHKLFPRARIIHTQRNPIDTCLSIHFQNFSNQHVYTTELDDLAFYYRAYKRLMDHWRKVLPPQVILDVPYEALLENQEVWSRKMIDFIGLEWDERCLNFHKTERKVHTSSNWQVRQPIYKTSQERWRNYAQFVEPLKPLLEL